MQAAHFIDHRIQGFTSSTLSKDSLFLAVRSGLFNAYNYTLQFIRRVGSLN
jgi:hypothetical protein